LYRQYFGKWFPIMVHSFGGDITYAEGFSGPGIYVDGAPGSPVIALNTVVGDRQLRTRARLLRMLFVDEDSRCTALLRERLAAAADPVALEDLPKHGITVDISTGPCVPTLQDMFDRHSAWGRPMLAVLDTWGGSVPYDLVRRIARNGHSEVLITIEPQYFSRFASVDGISYGDSVFGGPTWREVMNQPPEQKTRWLLEHYRDAIGAAGFDFVLDFELIDNRGQSLYLVFGTTHERGHEKMKEAMWEVDIVSGAGYRDPRDPDQETLAIEIEPNTRPLRRLILAHLRDRPGSEASVQELRNFALFKTFYKASHVMPMLREMIDAGELVSAAPGRLGFQGSVRLV
jgi:three-Cys-motif partner protein